MPTIRLNVNEIIISDMKLTKQNCCVFIENEAQLQEARKVLERYGEDHNFIWSDIEDNFLCLSGSRVWGVYGYMQPNETQITLPELVEILKGEKDESE